MVTRVLRTFERVTWTVVGTKTGVAKRGGRQEELPSPRPRPFFHPMRLRVSRNQCDQTISLFGYRILFSHGETNFLYVNEKDEETHHLATVNGTLSENFTSPKNLGNSSNRQKRYSFTSRSSFYVKRARSRLSTRRRIARNVDRTRYR